MINIIRYNINVGFIIYGQKPFCNEQDNPINDINDFVNFFKINSMFDINPIIVYDNQLSISEIDYNGSCYFLSPWNLNTERLKKIPLNTFTNFLLWDRQGLKSCYGGGTWGPPTSINSVPTISVPIYYNLDSCLPYDRFRTSQSLVLIHEFLHAISIVICEILNYGSRCIPTSDECSSMGYPNAWNVYDCYTFILSKITVEMYESIKNLNLCPNLTIQMSIM